MGAARVRVTCTLAALVGCGQHPPPVGPSTEDAPIHIIATERGPGGGVLVVIGEDGDRVGGLVAAPSKVPIRDTTPAFSPDGRYVVFASSRGRSIDESSLWAVAVGYDATPVRLTDTTAIDMTPAWTPDGAAIIYASSKGGSLDLWRLAVAIEDGAVHARGAPEALTSAPGQEVSPTVAPDGRIAYVSLTVGDDGATRSAIELRRPDGTTEVLAAGPGDASPRFDPTGDRLAFTRPTVRSGEAPPVDDPDGKPEPFSAIDADLWILDASGTNRVVDLPFTDESSPAWSVDGRWLFATSLVRKKTGDPVLSSVIDIDLEETPATARMLVDRAGAVTRLSPAVAPVVLDAAALHRGPSYVDELKRVLAAAFDRNEARPVE